MDLGPVPERLISANPGLKFCSTFYLFAYALLGVSFYVFITVSQTKGSTVFSIVSLSYMFLDKKTVLKMWLNLGLILTSFEEPGPGSILTFCEGNLYSPVYISEHQAWNIKNLTSKRGHDDLHLE